MTKIDIYDCDDKTLEELSEEFDLMPRDIVAVLLSEIDIEEIKNLLKRF